MDDVNRYLLAAQGFDVALEATRDDQFGDVTPCTEWRVDDLINHVIETHRRVLSMAVTLEDQGEPSSDLRQRWRQATEAVRVAVADPEVASKPVPSRLGERPFSSMIGGLLTIDTLCHTWDLQRATGQTESLDPDLVDFAHTSLTEFGSQIRVPGGFGPELVTPEDADAQTRFLRFAGRDA
jgi:uncharacterized protein (TIGR03086 family)